MLKPLSQTGQLYSLKAVIDQLAEYTFLKGELKTSSSTLKLKTITVMPIEYVLRGDGIVEGAVGTLLCTLLQKESLNMPQ